MKHSAKAAMVVAPCVLADHASTQAKEEKQHTARSETGLPAAMMPAKGINVRTSHAQATETTVNVLHVHASKEVPTRKDPGGNALPTTMPTSKTANAGPIVLPATHSRTAQAEHPRVAPPPTPPANPFASTPTTTTPMQNTAQKSALNTRKCSPTQTLPSV